jgi:hypothetical protein
VSGTARRLLAALPLAATAVATAWALSTNPFAAPLVERTEAELRAALDMQVARVATPAWLETALSDAVAERDADRAARLLALADELGRPVARAEAEALIARAARPAARAAACAACIRAPASCESVALIGLCTVPFELSPLGDVAALGRAGAAWAEGAPVDRLDAGLAAVGLGASAAVLASGGASAGVKVGAGLLRTARRMDALSPALVARLGRAEGAALAAGMGRVRAATSMPEALRLMRHVHRPEDAARLARVAEALGPRTLRTVEVLGPARALRATVRVTRMAVATAALVWLTLLQAATLLAARAGAALWRVALGPG